MCVKSLERQKVYGLSKSHSSRGQIFSSSCEANKQVVSLNFWIFFWNWSVFQLESQDSLKCRVFLPTHSGMDIVWYDILSRIDIINEYIYILVYTIQYDVRHISCMTVVELNNSLKLKHHLYRHKQQQLWWKWCWGHQHRMAWIMRRSERGLAPKSWMMMKGSKVARC